MDNARLGSGNPPFFKNETMEKLTGKTKMRKIKTLDQPALGTIKLRDELKRKVERWDGI
ncbi:hypothetical protein K3495_g15640 [Podosphaera aphanis]|nr:hypothetical protein K3495_g15640 [Podosphaera aphanis]